MLKKLSLILLIAVLAYSQVGYYFVIRISQNIQKEAVKEKLVKQLKEQELEAISLSDNQKEIYWEEDEDGEEFSLHGEMYDVVKRKIVNGKEILYCINDKKETALVDNYNLITKHNSSADKKGKSSIDNSFNLFVYQDDKKGDADNAPLLNTFYSFDSRLSEKVTEQISPPPKS